MNVRKEGHDDKENGAAQDGTICVLDKLKLAVPLPKPHCTLHIRGFHAENTICVANGQLK